MGTTSITGPSGSSSSRRTEGDRTRVGRERLKEAETRITGRANPALSKYDPRNRPGFPVNDDDDMPQWLKDLIAAQLEGDSGGGGFSGRPTADELALLREEAALGSAEAQRAREFEKQQMLLGRRFESEQAQKQREFERRMEEQRRALERQAQLRELQNARQAQYVDLIGRDPARAVLFAMGIGPEADRFNTAAKSLGATVKPLAGAEQSAQTTSSALDRLLGGGRDVEFGAQGITGLGPAVQAAKGFQQGGADAQKLLTSAFGVGATGGGGAPGMGAEQFQELIQAVTPKGI